MKNIEFKIFTGANVSDEIFEKIAYVENNSGGEPYEKEVLRGIVCRNSNVTITCYNRDEIIGFITSNMNSSKNNGCIYIINLSVEQKFHRQGIATNLIEEFINYCDLYNPNELPIYLNVDKDNEKAKKLYEKLGFEILEQDDEQYSMFLSQNKQKSNNKSL